MRCPLRGGRRADTQGCCSLHVSGPSAQTIFVPEECPTFTVDIAAPLAVSELLLTCNDTERGWLVVRGDQRWEAAPAYEGPAIHCPLREARFETLVLRGTRPCTFLHHLQNGQWLTIRGFSSTGKWNALRDGLRTRLRTCTWPATDLNFPFRRGLEYRSVRCIALRRVFSLRHGILQSGEDRTTPPRGGEAEMAAISGPRWYLRSRRDIRIRIILTYRYWY